MHLYTPEKPLFESVYTVHRQDIILIVRNIFILFKGF